MLYSKNFNSVILSRKLMGYYHMVIHIYEIYKLFRNHILNSGIMLDLQSHNSPPTVYVCDCLNLFEVLVLYTVLKCYL